MTANATVREVPAPTPNHVGSGDPSHPSVPDEPVLEVGDIQGNIAAGFLKDFQTLIYLQITDVKAFQAWLVQFIPLVASSAQVLAFNRLFKSLSTAQGRPPKIKATWINIAISYQGLQKIAKIIPDLLKEDFKDQAFKQGLQVRSETLGDEARPDKPGNKEDWKIGGPKNEPDVMVIVASDDENDLDAEVKGILSNLNGLRKMKYAMDRGATLPLDLNLRGHEHFGFLDGVSQPGLRGRLSNDPTDVLTPRQNPNDPDQGKPGQDVLWPGEFIFGYKEQDPNAKDPADGTGKIAEAGPSWARNGSFLVFRRLRQDVFGFHSFLKQNAKANGFHDADQLGSRLVGRWRSGAPVLREPIHDKPELGKDDCANNNFEFQKITPAITQAQKRSSFDCVDFTFSSSPGDEAGVRCPFGGHIRKLYPRDDISATASQTPAPPGLPQSDIILKEPDTQTHRLLRRGIPFGKASTSTPDRPKNDGNVDRGLLFLAYQTSIEDQFEFATKSWVNEKDFKEPGTGPDPLIGQNNASGENRRREFRTTDAAGKPRTLVTDKDWVIPTGGGYFFAPSITALNILSGTGVSPRPAQGSRLKRSS